MHASQTDSFLLMLPFVLLLMAVLLRLDEHIFASGGRKARLERPRFANFNRDADVMTDPDGRVGELPQRPRKRSR